MRRHSCRGKLFGAHAWWSDDQTNRINKIIILLSLISTFQKFANDRHNQHPHPLNQRTTKQSINVFSVMCGIVYCPKCSLLAINHSECLYDGNAHLNFEFILAHSQSKNVCMCMEYSKTRRRTHWYGLVFGKISTKCSCFWTKPPLVQCVDDAKGLFSCV